MSITHFTDAVEIEGSQDTTQLKVQGHSSQTEPLQSWEDSAGSPLSHITADGRLLVGDDPGMEAPDALVEAHRDITSVSVPQRALNTLGRVTGALGTAVQWVVHELELRGTGGISGLHTALRSRLIHADTGDSSDSELRAGDFETINQTGTTSERVGKAVALSAAVTNEAGAHLNTATGVEISLQNGDGGSISEAYGLKINDLDPSTATNSYALHTGTGVVRFGDAVAINAVQPDGSAALDIQSSSQGVLMPRMSQQNRDNIAAAATGLIVFNTTTQNLNVYDGSSWVEVGSGSVDWSAPGAIGSGVPNSGAFTTLTTTGNAGIGTTNPGAQFSVVGTSGKTVNFSAASDRDWYIDSDNPDQLKKDQNMIFVADPDNTHSNTFIGFRIDSTANSVMTLTANGSVGIGTANPGSILEVGDGTGSRVVRVYGADNSQSGINVGATQTNRWSIFQDTSNNNRRLVIYREGSGVSGSSGYRMVVSDTGNVGIGTTNPAAPLDVVGNLTVSGHLSKGSGSFVIDHPLRPQTHDLIHGFVEAPRFDLIYRGQASLNRGRARVNLDETNHMSSGTFEALTQNTQVFVQAHGSWELVRAQVSGHELHIESNDTTSTALVDWLVIAERADAYIKWMDIADDDGHLIVEREKPEPTADDLQLLEDRTDEGISEDREEIVQEIAGKRGYPRHPEALGIEHPRRIARSQQTGTGDSS